jgi:NDP-sugar pyrophosphorylase family protein
MLPSAIVLTAGLGTRLAPLTLIRAKPAVPVAGIPLVLRLLRWLADQNVQSVVLNLHHMPDTITRVVGHGNDAAMRVRYSWEPTILGSAGGLRSALSLLDKRFFVINGDTLTDLNLSDLQQTHDQTGADVTLATTDHPDPSRYGGVEVNDAGLAVRFCPAGTPCRHFVGVQMVESSVFSELAEGTPTAIIGGVYDALLANGPGRIATHHVTGRFHDIGTPADYLATSLEITRSEGDEAVPAGNRNRVHPTAVLTRTILWDDVVIGEHCHLTDCIVADGVELPAHTIASRTVIIATPQGPSHTSIVP